MRFTRLLPLVLAGAALVGCDEEPEAAAPNPPVAVWTPDSPAVAAADTAAAVAAPGDTAGAASAAPSEPAASGRPAPGGEVAQGGASGGGESAAPTPTPPAAAPAAPGGDAASVLLRAERAYESVRTLQADFVQNLSVPLLESTQRSRGTIYHRKPDRFLMRFSDPQGDIVVVDGQHVWLYYPSNDPGQVVRTSMGQAGRLDLQREFLSNPTERYDATLEGSEVVGGRNATRLRLVPRQQSPYRQVRIWIDDQDALARRFEITENNDAVRTVELSNLRVNANLPDDLFTFTPPPNVQIFDQ